MRCLLIVMAVTMMLIGTVSADTPSLSNAEAAKVLETKWNDPKWYRIPIGRPDVNSNKEGLEAFAKAGLISVQHDNMRQIVNVMAMPKGEKFLKTDSTGSYLNVPGGQMTITKVVRNDAIDLGIGTYRIVMVFYDVAIIPEVINYYKARYGTSFFDREKMRVLLKYDYFRSLRDDVGADREGVDKEFGTNSLRDALRKALQDAVP